MSLLKSAVMRLNKPGSTEEDVMLLQALVHGSEVFSTRMEEFQHRWEAGDYTEEEQRHVAQITLAFVHLVRALGGAGQDPMLWLGVLSLGKFTPGSDVFLKVDPTDQGVWHSVLGHPEEGPKDMGREILARGFEHVMIHRGNTPQ